MLKNLFAKKVLMVRPTCFYSNTHTSGDNAFMKPTQFSVKESTIQAQKEFDCVVQSLIGVGVEVLVYPQQADDLPDSVFPNNWLSTHAPSTLMTYRMASENRHREINLNIIRDLGYANFADYNEISRFVPLEGTGSLVFDHSNKVIYIGESPRGSLTAVDCFMELFDTLHPGYRTCTFKAFDRRSQPIYHTNVVFALLDKHAIVCLDAIKLNQSDQASKSQIDLINQTLLETDKTLVPITMEEMENFCGNCIQLSNSKGESVVLMSERARKSFKQTDWMSDYKHIVSVDIETIEQIGGGSARCMVAELF